jgi:hypothetical protein
MATIYGDGTKRVLIYPELFLPNGIVLTRGTCTSNSAQQRVQRQQSMNPTAEQGPLLSILFGSRIRALHTKSSMLIFTLFPVINHLQLSYISSPIIHHQIKSWAAFTFLLDSRASRKRRLQSCVKGHCFLISYFAEPTVTSFSHVYYGRNVTRCVFLKAFRTSLGTLLSTP